MHIFSYILFVFIDSDFQNKQGFITLLSLLLFLNFLEKRCFKNFFAGFFEKIKCFKLKNILLGDILYQVAFEEFVKVILFI